MHDTYIVFVKIEKSENIDKLVQKYVLGVYCYNLGLLCTFR